MAPQDSKELPMDVTQNVAVIREFVEANSEWRNLSAQQIMMLATNWLAGAIRDDPDQSDVRALAAYLRDTPDVLDGDDATVLYGPLIPLTVWAERQSGAARTNARRYAIAGRIPGARRPGRDWLVPENAPLLPG